MWDIVIGEGAARPGRRQAALAVLLLCAVASCGAPEGHADAETVTRDGGLDDLALDCPDCTLFVGGRLFDGTAFRNGVLAVRGRRIERVVFGTADVRSGTVVNIAGKTVLPGLFDTHVHSAASSAPYDYVTAGSKTYVMEHLKAMLRAGVTSYLDLGTQGRLIFTYRQRSRTGALLGPHLFASGPMITPSGGHPCLSGSPTYGSCILLDQPADVAKLAADLFPHRPDVVKLIIEGGTPYYPLPRVTRESMASVASAAAEHGVPVVAHVSSSIDIVDALDSGIRLFAHVPSYDRISRDLALRLAEENAVVIPTLSVIDNLDRIAHGTLNLDDPALPHSVPQEIISALKDPKNTASLTTPAYRQWVRGDRDNAFANFRTCVEAGVTIAAGTDAGNPATFHGLAIVRELELYTQHGMTNLEALRSATQNAAALLQAKEVGRLAAGYVADFIVIDGDPLQRIGDLGRISAVYRGGRRLEPDELSLKKTLSLELTPVKNLQLGQACLAAGECGDDLVCDLWDVRCAKACDAQAYTGCEAGSACFPLSEGSGAGYCFAGDGCDLFGQDCENKAACVWIGNAATTCWYAGAGKEGDLCSSAGGTCAPGFQCDYYANTCKKICHPSEPSKSSCGANQSCEDMSAYAGLSVGQCG